MKDNLLRCVFDKYNINKDGYLCYSEFKRFIIRLAKHTNVNTNQDSIKYAFAYLDTDGDGRLSFDEFKSWWLKEGKYDIFCGTKSILLRKAYKLYQTYTSDDKMSLSNFRQMMVDMGIDFEEEEFYNIDIDKNGILTFDEFVKWLRWF